MQTENQPTPVFDLELNSREQNALKILEVSGNVIKAGHPELVVNMLLQESHGSLAFLATEWVWLMSALTKIKAEQDQLSASIKEAK